MVKKESYNEESLTDAVAVFRTLDVRLRTGRARVRSTILRKYHLKNLEINAQVYDDFTSDDRSITSVTCSLSKEGFEKVRAEIASFRERILAIAREDREPDRVCHVGFQLVPRAKGAK